MPFYSQNQLIQVLKKLGIIPEASKGQNYIINFPICQRIAQTLELDAEKDTVLEIGPGLGAFTDLLVKSSHKICIIEEDRQTVKFLENYYRKANEISIIETRNIKYLGYIPLKNSITIVHSNALDVPFPPVSQIVSNVPFKISVDFIIKLIQSWEYKKAVLIFQKEFVDHLIAQPNQPGYTLISVLANLFFDVSILEKMSPEMFYPKPIVSSILLKITPTKYLDQTVLSYEERLDFIYFIKKLFPFKNKPFQKSINLTIKGNSDFLERFPHILQEMKNYDGESKALKQYSARELLDLMKNSKIEN